MRPSRESGWLFVPFDHGTLKELFETESNNTVAEAMVIQSTCTMNGRIDQPGDRDIFAIELKKGEPFVAEVKARRLNSPFDSVLMITDPTGKQVAFNDDHEDRSLGLVTHHADSCIVFKAPQSGIYHIHLADTQNRGDSTHAYRLQLSRPQPDHELPAVPSYLNGQPGANVSFTVYALRKDRFNRPATTSLDKDGIKLLPGKNTKLTYKASTSFERFQVDLELVPRNLPPGVDIQEVAIGNGLIEVTLSTDESATRGLEGNILFDQFILRQRGGESKQKEDTLKTLRIEAGTLPAVPFRIM